MASDELIEIVGEKLLTEDKANSIIMAARAHWFDDETDNTESSDGTNEVEIETPVKDEDKS